MVDNRKAGAIFPGKEQNRHMATKEWLPPQLVDKVVEAAAKEEISPEEFVRGAVETRLDRGKWLSGNPARILDMAEAGVEIGHGAPSVPSIKKTR